MSCHARGAPRPVRRITAFRDDALEAEVLARLEQRHAVVEVVGIDQTGHLGFREQVLQPFLALDQRQGSEVAPVEVQQIEGDDTHASTCAALELATGTRVGVRKPSYPHQEPGRMIPKAIGVEFPIPYFTGRGTTTRSVTSTPWTLVPG